MREYNKRPVITEKVAASMRPALDRENAPGLIELASVKCGWVTQVRWSPAGDRLAIASASGIRLYEGGVGGVPDRVIEGEKVKGIAFSPDGQTLAAVSEDRLVRLWQVEDTTQPTMILKGHTDSVDAVIFSPDGQTLATAGTDRTIRMWDMSQNGKEKAVLTGHEKEITSLAFALEGNVLVSGSRDKTIRLWDVASETSGTILGEHTDWVREVAASPASTMIASAGKDNAVHLWDAYAEERYAVLWCHDKGVDAVAFHPGGRLLATGGRDNLICLWNLDQALQVGELQQSDALITLHGHRKPVLSLAFNAAGTMLASGSGDNTVRLWGMPTES